MAFVATNLSVYLSVAEEAAAEAAQLLEAGRTPMPDGLPGFVITPDPERRSFKQSMIAIAFAGMYLEALLGLVGNARLGKALYNKVERITNYEEKLSMLGILDPSVLADCKRFREARNDLMHEKSVDLDALKSSDLRSAQREASFGVEFVRSIGALLKPAP